MVKLLFIGDIVGRPGRNFVLEKLPEIRKELEVDFVVANAENSAGGAGLSGKIAQQLKEGGVDAITLGDHVWDQRGFDLEISDLDWVCRPANLPENCPGRRYLVIERGGIRIGVFTVLGRQFLTALSSCPFSSSDQILSELEGETDAVITEIHAEATSEKIAFGWYLDGRTSAVIGTHTHVPTADATILPRGTGYLTDSGMTGPHHSVLGRDVQPVVARYLDGMPRKFTVAEGDVRLSGAVVTIDPASGFCRDIEQVQRS
ncbi:MAG: 2',3'-cyclic-nucleotide 2'-phosphodiesterase [Candidatus Moanabacter tarae]|uniref:2',3'-cyclic-nucleotide 2'-phosphodiesterase n=1 Tax=Candidatus Moanibacter tarae TaxID=2200854 RepID=A0A2Z4AKA3_9BACT|nr:MAG: 2',3'-cyclic-nucleotide 2'-phosphodiesterase [Candidatus Moanabacter tarae]|tara:strand:- start:92611 stop:93390 length:780 start_codon:yes stop_codon:yes gene_type:complete